MAKVSALKPRRSTSEIGSTGLVQYAGYVQEEFLRDLQGPRWRRAVREMSTNDPVIAAMFFAVEYLCRQVTWDVKPGMEDDREAEEAADFIRTALLEDMSQSWNDLVAEILSFLPWGWAYFEIVYKQRMGEQREPGQSSKYDDNRLAWRKWAIRGQDSLLRWEFDESNGVQAMIQQAAPDYREIPIPIEKAVLFRTSTHKNNPEGRSLLRSAYRPWYFKKAIEEYEAIGIERDLAGLPVLKVPARILTAEPGTQEALIAEEYKKVGTTVKANEQGCILLASDVYPETKTPMYDFSLVSANGAKRVNAREVIAGKNLEILMSLMADFLIIGHQKVGSFALVGNKTKLFNTALGSFLDTIAETVNRHPIPRLLRLNGMSTMNPPKLTHGDIESVALLDLADFISKTSGVLNAREVAYLLGEAGLPERSEEEIQEEEDRRQENLNQRNVVDKQVEDEE